MRQYFVYIMASRSGVLYTGMTGDLRRRVYQHKHKLLGGFSAKHNVTRLVFFETFREVRDAMRREKQIKSWRRITKIDLIESLNPSWLDLSEEWDS